MSTKPTPPYTGIDAARDLFTAGYLQACDQIEKRLIDLGLPGVPAFMEQFRGTAAAVQAKNVIDRVGRSAS